MNPRIFLVCCFTAVSGSIFSQAMDTIVLTNKKIIASIKEVTPETVGYKLADSDIVYKTSTRDLVRISYANGKKEESAFVKKPLLFKLEDWREISIVNSPEEIHGLYKIGEAIIPGRMSHETMKMTAAMMGGNVVQYNGQLTFSRYSHPYPSYQFNSLYFGTNVSVYTSQLIDTVLVKKMAKDGALLGLVSHFATKGLRKYRITDVNTQTGDYTFSRFEFDGPNTYVWIKGDAYAHVKFRVNYIDKTRLLLSYLNRWNGRYEVLMFLIRNPKRSK